MADYDAGEHIQLRVTFGFGPAETPGELAFRAEIGGFRHLEIFDGVRFIERAAPLPRKIHPSRAADKAVENKDWIAGRVTLAAVIDETLKGHDALVLMQRCACQPLALTLRPGGQLWVSRRYKNAGRAVEYPLVPKLNSASRSLPIAAFGRQGPEVQVLSLPTSVTIGNRGL